MLNTVVSYHTLHITPHSPQHTTLSISHHTLHNTPHSPQHTTLSTTQHTLDNTHTLHYTPHTRQHTTLSTTHHTLHNTPHSSHYQSSSLEVLKWLKDSCSAKDSPLQQTRQAQPCLVKPLCSDSPSQLEETLL